MGLRWENSSATMKQRTRWPISAPMFGGLKRLEVLSFFSECVLFSNVTLALILTRRCR